MITTAFYERNITQWGRESWSSAAAGASTRWPGRWRARRAWRRSMSPLATREPAGQPPLAALHQSRCRSPIAICRGLLRLAQEQQIDLTVVGPEAPLAAGVVDTFQAQGLAVFGPSRAAAQLEASKAFSKIFMREHGIPTAEFRDLPGLREGSTLCHAAEPPAGDQGRRAGRRQGRGRLRRADRGAGGAAAHTGRSRVRRCRRERAGRGAPGWARGLAAGLQRRAQRRGHAAGPRPQARLRRRPRPEHRRHGCLRAGATT